MTETIWNPKPKIFPIRGPFQKTPPESWSSRHEKLRAEVSFQGCKYSGKATHIPKGGDGAVRRPG